MRNHFPSPEPFPEPHSDEEDRGDDWVKCAWCGEWVEEDSISSNSDENTIPGTLGGGESICESCRDGAS